MKNHQIEQIVTCTNLPSSVFDANNRKQISQKPESHNISTFNTFKPRTFQFDSMTALKSIIVNVIFCT